MLFLLVYWLWIAAWHGRTPVTLLDMKQNDSLAMVCALATIVGLVSRARADEAQGTPASLLARRSLSALRVAAGAVRVDGSLDETAWTAAQVADRFIQSFPDPGRESKLRTEVRVLYDDDALYIGVRMFDPEPRAIRRLLGRRDDEPPSDWVFVQIDSRHDRRSAFSFGVNPAGVQVDGVFFNDAEVDTSWNGVWDSAVQIDERGWTAEFRIPFSQLAFDAPQGSRDAVWGFNVYRASLRTGEQSNWSARWPALGGVSSRFNELHLRPPVHIRRLEITPYVSAQIQRNERPAGFSLGSALRGGLDVNVGLTSNLNLTATVLPDFGQVEADPTQINLTSFELFQQERRPFFTEGIDAFRFDTGLSLITRDDSFFEETSFYSRRIGRAPSGALPTGAQSVEQPSATTILGAAKLFGRSADGWHAGFLASLLRREEALVANKGGPLRFPVEPATQAAIARIAKESVDGNAAVGIFLSGLHRTDVNGVLASQFVSDALTGGVDGRLRWCAQTYEARGFLLASNLAGTHEAIVHVAEQPWHNLYRPDALHLRPADDATHLRGFEAEGRFSKVSGSLLGSIIARAISPGFDVNELGFQRNSDWLLLVGQWSFEHYPTTSWLRRWQIGSDNAGLGWSMAGERRAGVVNGYVTFEYTNFWDSTLTLQHEFASLSTEWLRGGPALLLPPRETARLQVHSDARKPSFAGLDATASIEPGSNSSTFRITPSATLRLTDHLVATLQPSYQDQRVGWQYLATNGAGPPANYLVGDLRQRTVSVSVRADLALSPKLIIQLYAQPLVTTARYSGFERLLNPRAAEPSMRFAKVDVGSLGDGFVQPDGVERTLLASAVLRWELMPGSYLTAVWTHRGDHTVATMDPRLGSQIGRVLTEPGTDVLLTKLSYFWSP